MRLSCLVLPLLAACTTGVIKLPDAREQPVGDDTGDDGVGEDTGDEPAGALALTPATLTLDSLVRDCAGMGTIALSNVGEAPLLVSDLRLTADEVATWSLQTPPELPLELAPSASVTLSVLAEAHQVGSAASTLAVDSDDSLQPTAEASVHVEILEPTVYEDTLEVVAVAGTDIVFALDTSGSMMDDLNGLRAELPSLLNILDEAGVDTRVTVSVADSGCVTGTDLFFDRGHSDAEILSLFDAMSATTGTPALAEMNLERLLLFLNQTPAGECNAGLLPADRQTVFVAVSDEPDQSPDSVEDYAARFDGSDVRLFGIGGPYPTGCGGTAQPYSGVYETAEATGGTLYSICAPMDETMAALALEIQRRALTTTMVLDPPADPISLAVYVDGALQSEGWSYDTGSSTFGLSVPLPAGTSVQVRWSAANPCE